MDKPQTELAVPKGLEGVADALVRSRATTLADLYDAWRGLLSARSGAAAQRAREREALEVRAQMVLRSVENARQMGLGAPTPEKAGKPKRGQKLGRAKKAGKTAALAKGDPLAGFIAESQQEIEAARASLEVRDQEHERFFAGEVEHVKRRIRERADAVLKHHRPRVEAQVQPVGKDLSLVHLARPEPEDVVLLCYVLCGKLFTRYDAFSDDAVDQLDLEPARFYAEDGNERVRFDTLEDEEALVDAPGRIFLPAKGMIPFRLPDRDFPRFRLMNRGPVMEAEAREKGGAFSHLMSRESAELLSGFLIKLKIEGRLDLALRVG